MDVGGFLLLLFFPDTNPSDDPKSAYFPSSTKSPPPPCPSWVDQMIQKYLLCDNFPVHEPKKIHVFLLIHDERQNDDKSFLFFFFLFYYSLRSTFLSYPVQNGSPLSHIPPNSPYPIIYLFFLELSF